MSPEERDIAALDDIKIAESRVVEMYNRIDDFSDENKRKIALALKAYWKAYRKWEIRK
ncbi:MAG: hypothetical protein LWX51_05320 [Deltaproteobacteria bacterium]|jgi:50S ribosomal subunit-associated GTPase HflX|nr:hypothetical protein [Deltaproteobacteria bacterium]